MGNILRADLTTGSFKEENIGEEKLRKFIGSSALGAKIIYDELDPSIEPLHEGNILVFMTGPLTGTVCPSCSSASARGHYSQTSGRRPMPQASGGLS